MLRLLLSVSLFLAGAEGILAQRVLWWVNGEVDEGYLGTKVIAAGDIDGDGVSELLATAPNVNGAPGRVLLISGRSGARLRTFSTTQRNTGFGSDAAGIVDCNGDGVRDVVIGASWVSQLLFHSGATGVLIRTVNGPQGGYGGAVAAIGDVNGDGRGDVVTTSNGSPRAIVIVSGANGAVLGTFPDSAFSDTTDLALRTLPDLDGDGRPEVLATESGRFVRILDPFPVPSTRAINGLPGSSTNLGRDGAGFADLDGDGVVELLLADSGANFSFRPYGCLYIVSPTTGALIDTLREAPGGHAMSAASIAGIGDLDGDGHGDVLFPPTENVPSELAVLSGRTRTWRWYWDSSPPIDPLGVRKQGLISLGDVDGDGFEDLAIGNPYALSQRGQVTVLSGRFIAYSTRVPTNCGAGPFLPELGVSRPILGTTAQVVVRDAPPNAPGLLILSAAPRRTTNLGVLGCDVAFDLGAWAQLANLAGSSSYSVPLPIPQIPQFAGLDIALQAFFIPTSGPLGFDLSNGVWARVGY